VAKTLAASQFAAQNPFAVQLQLLFAAQLQNPFAAQFQLQLPFAAQLQRPFAAQLQLPFAAQRQLPFAANQHPFAVILAILAANRRLANVVAFSAACAHAKAAATNFDSWFVS